MFSFTNPEIAKNAARITLKGHFALYERCDQSLCAPAVIPIPPAIPYRDTVKINFCINICVCVVRCIKTYSLQAKKV
jgi:hypothetical protein